MGTEHLLVSLVDEEDSVERRPLGNLGITTGQVLAQINRMSGPSGETPQSHIAFTPRLKRVIELAFRTSLRHGSPVVEPEHLAIGIVAEGNGTAIKILGELGIDPEAVRDHAVGSLLAAARQPTSTPLPSSPPPQEEPPTTTVFISYRRVPDGHAAARLADALAAELGPGTVFMDIDSIRPSTSFTEAVTAAVASCSVLVALISKGWAQLTDTRGRVRLELADDYVRTEIDAAMQRGIPIVPVLLDDAEMPTAAELPRSLSDLAYVQAIRIRLDSFRHDTERLVQFVLDR
jgi:hypothetical protein